MTVPGDLCREIVDLQLKLEIEKRLTLDREERLEGLQQALEFIQFLTPDCARATQIATKAIRKFGLEI